MGPCKLLFSFPDQLFRMAYTAVAAGNIWVRERDYILWIGWLN